MYSLRRAPAVFRNVRVVPSCHCRWFASRGIRKAADYYNTKKTPSEPQSARDVYEQGEVAEEMDGEQDFYAREPASRTKESSKQSKWSQAWRKQDLGHDDHSSNNETSQGRSFPFTRGGGSEEGKETKRRDQGWKGGLNRYKDSWKQQEKEEAMKKADRAKERPRSTSWRDDGEKEQASQRRGAEEREKVLPYSFTGDFEGEIHEEKKPLRPSDLYSPGKPNSREKDSNPLHGRQRHEKASPKVPSQGFREEDYFESNEDPAPASSTSRPPKKLDSHKSISTAQNSSGSRTNRTEADNNPSKTSSSFFDSMRREGQELSPRRNSVLAKEADTDKEVTETGKGSWFNGSGKSFNEETGKSERVRWGTSRRPKSEIDEQTAWENKIGRRFGRRMAHQRTLPLEELEKDSFSADDDDNSLPITMPVGERRSKRGQGKYDEVDASVNS